MLKDLREKINQSPVKTQVQKTWVFLLLSIAISSQAPGVSFAEVTSLSIAQSQIGLGEIGGNNKGCYVRQYLNGQENLPWCAGFVSYCVKKSGLNLRYTLRAKDYLKMGKIVNNPQTGDLIIFSRQGGGHIGIIEKITKDTITTIEGNLGDYPAKVKRVIYKRNHIKNLLGYVKLEKGRER